MADYSFKPEDVINAREMYMVKPKPPTPIDKEVSKIVGQEVKVNDPRLIQMVVKWKKEANKPESDLSRDDFLYDGKKIQELKEAFK